MKTCVPMFCTRRNVFISLLMFTFIFGFTFIFSFKLWQI